MKLEELASTIDARLENGEGSLEITGVAAIEKAVAGQITFVANPKYSALAKTTRASAVIVSEDFPSISGAMLRSKNPYLSFTRAMQLFHPAPKYTAGVHPTAVVHPSATLGKNAHVAPYVVIEENVSIGANAVLLAHVVIYADVQIGDSFLAHAHSVVREGCRIGNRVTLGNGAIVGGDGFGFAKDDTDDGRWHKIPQPKVVVIGDDVEIQSNACVDRGSLGQTQIGNGTKIDNLVQVGHGSTIGEHSLLASQVGIAGSTEIGNRVILTGQVGVVGHCKVGDGAIVTPQSGVSGDIEAGVIVSGSPAVDHKAWLKYSAILPRLPEIWKLVRGKKES
jgi:UDP-3-O-[3-hydroxymyristoyl] glucosamine N-acyltransferase